MEARMVVGLPVFKEIPKFVKLIETHNGVYGEKVPNIQEVIEDVFDVSVKRGLNDEEFTLLIRLFCKGSLKKNEKLKLLQNMVPENKAPDAAIRQFMVWFISNMFRDGENFSTFESPRILQWIISLLEHNLVESREIDTFYYDFLSLLEIQNLVPYAAKLLCRLTKPADVTGQTVGIVSKALLDPSNKYILAVLNVFQTFKPHLMPKNVKKVDVVKVLASVNHSMDSFMRVRAINTRMPTSALGVCEVPTRNPSYFKDELTRPSSLIPLTTYNLEGAVKSATLFPDSVEDAYRNFSRVPIPENIMSLLQSDAGFFILLYQGIEVQMRFQNSLLQTLQNALIYKDLKSSDEDVEVLLRKVYCLQTFMQQGIPSVSVFLSGYLLNWDGLDHRYNILKLIEFSTFHSFSELACNILRPLHMLFVTYNTSMKIDIIQTLVNLIRNMFDDMIRSQQGIRFPFLKRGPKWTKQPMVMLHSLICWTEGLITLGLRIEQHSTVLLLESIRFYEMVNKFEIASSLPMFTVVSEGVVLQSLLSQCPSTIIGICRLLLRYHKEFLPRLRLEHPNFYENSKENISLTSNYVQQIIYFLQSGQVVPPRKENGIILREIPNESMASGVESFSLTSHSCFVATYLTFESTKNNLDLSNPVDRRTAVELASMHLREIMEFMSYFSPSGGTESSQ